MAVPSGCTCTLWCGWYVHTSISTPWFLCSLFPKTGGWHSSSLVLCCIYPKLCQICDKLHRRWKICSVCIPPVNKSLTVPLALGNYRSSHFFPSIFFLPPSRFSYCSLQTVVGSPTLQSRADPVNICRPAAEAPQQVWNIPIHSLIAMGWETYPAATDCVDQHRTRFQFMTAASVSCVLEHELSLQWIQPDNATLICSPRPVFIDVCLVLQFDRKCGNAHRLTGCVLFYFFM